MMNPLHLRTFLLVQKLSSFTAAAKQLSPSQLSPDTFSIWRNSWGADSSTSFAQRQLHSPIVLPHEEMLLNQQLTMVAPAIL
jgi:hypothetical protein